MCRHHILMLIDPQKPDELGFVTLAIMKLTFDLETGHFNSFAEIKYEKCHVNLAMKYHQNISEMINYTMKTVSYFIIFLASYNRNEIKH